jgi:pilus assembly protein CpaB
MNKVAIIPLAVGLIIGVVAIKFGLDTLQEAKASGRVELVNAVVAIAEIPATYEIAPNMVKLIETPKTPLLGTDSFTELKDVVGRVVDATIPAGSAIREAILAPDGTPPGLRVRIAPGFRAVSVKIDEVSGVAYQLQPGSFVDVFAVMTSRRDGSKKTASRLVLQQVEVGAVGRTLSSGADPGGKGKAAKSVTLLVKDREVSKLHLAQVRGKLTFALRGSDDESLADNEWSPEAEELAELQSDLSQPDDKPVTKTQPKDNTFMMVVRNGESSSEYAFSGKNSMRMERHSTRRPTRRGSLDDAPSRRQHDNTDNNDDIDDDDENDDDGYTGEDDAPPMPPLPPG